MSATPDDEPLTLEDLTSPPPEPRRFRRLHRYYRSEPVLDDEPEQKKPSKPVKPINRTVTLSPPPDLRPADGHFKFDFQSAMSLNQSRFVFRGNPTEKGVAKRIVPLVPVAKKSIFKKPVPPPEKTEYVHLPKHTRRVIDAISSSIVSLPAPLFVAPKMSAPRRLTPVMDSETNSRKRLRETVEELGGDPLETEDPSTFKRPGNQTPRPASQATSNTQPATTLPFLSQLPPTPKPIGLNRASDAGIASQPAPIATSSPAASTGRSVGSPFDNIGRLPSAGEFGTFGAPPAPAPTFQWFGNQPSVTPAGIPVPAATVTPTPLFGGFGARSAPPLPVSQPAASGAFGTFGALITPPPVARANASAASAPAVSESVTTPGAKSTGKNKTHTPRSSSSQQTPRKKLTLKKSTTSTAAGSDDDPFEGINTDELYLPASMRHVELEAANMDLRCPEFDEWPEADYWYPPEEMDRLMGKESGSVAKPPVSASIKVT